MGVVAQARGTTTRCSGALGGKALRSFAAKCGFLALRPRRETMHGMAELMPDIPQADVMSSLRSSAGFRSYALRG